MGDAAQLVIANCETPHAPAMLPLPVMFKMALQETVAEAQTLVVAVVVTYVPLPLTGTVCVVRSKA